MGISRRKGDEILRAVNALQSSRADDYTTWLQLGMILHSVDPGDEMLQVWEKWSQQSSEYDPGACPRKRESFGAGGLEIGTLYHWARVDAGAMGD